MYSDFKKNTIMSVKKSKMSQRKELQKCIFVFEARNTCTYIKIYKTIGFGKVLLNDKGIIFFKSDFP